MGSAFFGYEQRRLWNFTNAKELRLCIVLNQQLGAFIEARLMLWIYRMDSNKRSVNEEVYTIPNILIPFRHKNSYENSKKPWLQEFDL